MYDFKIGLLFLGLILMGCGIKGLPKPPLIEETNIQNQRMNDLGSGVISTKKTNSGSSSSDKTEPKSKK